MARPRRPSSDDQHNSDDKDLFLTWGENDPKGMARAMASSGHALSNTENAVYRSHAAYYDVGGNMSVRNGMSQADYSRFRPGEGRPKKPRDIMAAVQSCYDEFGIVRNIIDTMTDFTVQGIHLVHPHPRIEEFFKNWFERAEGPDISAHIAQNLFLEANAPVRRHTAKILLKDRENIQKGIADNGERPLPPLVLNKKEIPWTYTVLNPVQTVVLGGNMAPFMGAHAFTYAVEIPTEIINTIKRPKSVLEKQFVENLPDNIRQNVKDGMNLIPLSSDQMHVLHYKRRHWQVWATPMTYPLLDDLNMLRKLKLADLSALDGAISHIRIWRLGSLEHRMMPSKKAIEKLADMLANAGNGVSMDLIWGPDLQLQETSTDIHHFLGEAKYGPHLAAIYSGYGIPPTLTGAAVSGGYTNNFISLKTLTDRLQYVRRLISEFWRYECKLIQQAMGFSLPPIVRFGRMVLTDEAAEKALLIQLIDRDLISVETIQERFGEDTIIEEARQRQDARKRNSKKIPKKAGPWHNPQHDEEMKKAILQAGTVAPSEVGVELSPKKPGEQNGLEVKKKNTPKPPASPIGGPVAQNKKPRGQPQQGRPKNSKDTEKRKQKVVRVKAKSALMDALSWAEDTQKAIADVTTPVYLKSLGKKNLRQLTTEESANFERFKFAVLVNMPLGVSADTKTISSLLVKELTIPNHVNELLRRTMGKYAEKEGKDPTYEKLREWHCQIVALYKGEFDGESDD